MSIDSKKITKYNKFFWILFVTPLFIIFLIFLLAANGKLGYMPRVEDLENPKINLATLIISEDGETLGSIYYKNQNRTHIEYERLPQHLVDALVATEDIRYYKHSGIDFRGLARAIIKTGILQQEAGGGSTITQQLAKLLFHTPPSTRLGRLKQKVKEMIIAAKLEKSYTKEEIISLYFNQYDFIYQAVGVHSASQVYFNKLPDSLKIEESAVLVGMAKNAVLYNPKRFPERALKRRNTVLSQMHKYGFLDTEAYDSIRTLPLELDFQRVDHNVGLATYYREYVKRTLSREKPIRKAYRNYATYQRDSTRWANDPIYGWCNKNTKPNGDPYDIYTDGLRIFTPINSKMQQYAEEAVSVHLGTYLQNAFFEEKKGKRRAPFDPELTNSQVDRIIRNAIRYSHRGRLLYNQGKSMDEIYEIFKQPVEMTVFSWKGNIDTLMSPLDSIIYYKHFLHSGLMAMDPNTGYVRAYVGGINYSHFKYDHVTQGKRQAGSTFKPFLYILAMQEDYSPCYEVPVVPTTFIVGDTTWTPRTTCRKEDLGSMKTLKWGLAKSENYVSAYLVNEFKPEPIATIAYKMGIESYIDPVPSMIYGTSDMSVAEMVGAYGTIANQGVHIKPLYVTRIEDKFGNVLATFVPETKEAISDQTAYLMLNLMQGVTTFGTGIRLRSQFGFTGEIAGKTGTTNNNSDAWFMGITPGLVGGVWVGADDRSVHFHRRSTKGTGSHSALPIWGEFMKRVYADSTLGITQEDVFLKPDLYDVDLNCEEDAKQPGLFEEDPLGGRTLFGDTY